MLLGYTPYFELLSNFNELNQILVVYVNLAQVHKIQYCTNHLTFHAIDEEHGMRAGIFLHVEKQIGNV